MLNFITATIILGNLLSVDMGDAMTNMRQCCISHIG